MHPTYWPEVRRGSERFVHDLAAHLSGRGHEVTVLTAHGGRPRRSSEDGFTVIRGWRPPRGLRPARSEPYVNHAPLALLSVALRRFDLVHALHIPDAWAISRLARLRRLPLVLSLMGFPDERSVAAFRFRRTMLTAAARRAGAVHALSEASAAALLDSTGIDAVAIPPGTETSAFQVDVPRAEHPTIFCAASPEDPRKRVGLLAEVFRVVREAHPDARLVIDAGSQGDACGELAGDGVELVDARRRGLATHYAEAWTTVLPSEREAFGLVVVESLAAGTPAVGMRDGGVAEILDDPTIGVLCERPEAGVLAEAVMRGLELGGAEGVRDACRRHAERWDWRQVGPRFEDLYRQAADRARVAT